MHALPLQAPVNLASPEPPVLEGLPLLHRDLLNHLRMTSLHCRTSRRTDLFEACAVLSSSETIAKNAYAETLMKCLSQAMGKAPELYRPGVKDISFDEAWLLRTTEMASRKDWQSFEFLLRSRVRSHALRNVASLFIGISKQFSLI